MSTRAQILAKIAAQFPDNTTGLITPAKLRQVVEDVTNSCLVSETDAGTAGRAVLQAGTQAQVRAAAGFGGTVTVAQLNAAGADARSALYYCSDCLTVNGPGSLVAWCGRTSTWRTLDDCLLATTDFATWVNDFIKNSNSSEIRGVKGGLWCALDTASAIHLTSATGGAIQLPPTSFPVRRSLTTGTSNVGFSREYTTPYGLTLYSANMKVFAGVRGNSLSSVSGGFTARLGITAYNAITRALATDEDSLCYDVGNVLGALNPSGLPQWLACYRIGSVNQSGSGPTGVGPSAGISENLSVVKQGTSVSMYQNGTLISSGTGGTARPSPFFIISNDGTATTSIEALQLGFCSGYLLP